MPVSNYSRPVTLSESLASRYEALARIAELIRCHPEERVLFQTCARELHQVVAFDGLSWFDPAANRVNGIFSGPMRVRLRLPPSGILRKRNRSRGGCTRISER